MSCGWFLQICQPQAEFLFPFLRAQPLEVHEFMNFTASFNESYQNQDKIQDFLGLLPSFPWLGDFGFSFLKSCACTAELNTVQEILGRAEPCILWNGNNTQLTRLQACNKSNIKLNERII